MKKLIPRIAVATILLVVLTLGVSMVSRSATAAKPGSSPAPTYNDCPICLVPPEFNPNYWVYDGWCDTIYGTQWGERCWVRRHITTGQRCKDPYACWEL